MGNVPPKDSKSSYTILRVTLVCEVVLTTPLLLLYFYSQQTGWRCGRRFALATLMFIEIAFHGIMWLVYSTVEENPENAGHKQNYKYLIQS